MQLTFKKFTLAGILFTLLAGTLSHFCYDWSGNFFLAGLIFPVNETVWEHEKLLFFPALLFILLEKRCLSYRSPELYEKNLLGLYLGMAAMPILYYAYTIFTGHSILAVDITIFAVCVLITFLFAVCTGTIRLPKSIYPVLHGLLLFLLLTFFSVSVFFMLF